MTARLIDGTAIGAKVRADLKIEADAWIAATGITPGLTVVLVGDDPASAAYVGSKGRACEALGWRSTTIRLPADTPHDTVAETLRGLNDDPAVHGILLQLPLPPQCDARALLEMIRPEKDVDGFHPVNVGKLSLGIPAPVPCTPAGVRRLLLESGIATAGAHAVVIGRSDIVGKPVAQLLLAKGPGGDATVTVAHSRTRNLPELCRSADILVAAIGSAGFVKGGWIKPGATVIDVGINRVPDLTHPKGGRLVGDVDFAAASEVAGAITPVPGGVGPMTIAMLMANTLECARAAAGPR